MNVTGKINYLGSARYRLWVDTGNEDEYDNGYLYLDDIVDDLGWRGEEVSLNIINTGQRTVLMIVGPTEEP